MAQNVLSITQLTEYIRGRLDDDPFLGQVAIWFGKGNRWGSKFRNNKMAGTFLFLPF